MNAGHQALLNVECRDGKLSVDLKAEIALDAPPKRQIRGPAYKRRQERLQASRSDAEEATTVKEEAEKQITSYAAATSSNANVTEKVDVTSLEKDTDNYPCQNCDFTSCWENGLKIHMTYAHAENYKMDRALIDKYENTSNFWKTGHLGTFYRRFLDANEMIEDMDLIEEERSREKNKILEARKMGFNGNNWQNFPPWSN